MKELTHFVDNLAWIIGLPASAIFLAKLLGIFHDSKNQDISFGIGWFLVPAICWAWIFR